MGGLDNICEICTTGATLETQSFTAANLDLVGYNASTQEPNTTYLSTTANHTNEVEIYEAQSGLITGTVIKIAALPPCIIGNVIIFVALWKYNKLWHSQSNMYILSLSVADFLVGVVLIPFETVVSIHQLFNSNALDDAIFCVIHRFLTTLLLGSSLASMLMISVDRYIAIIYPFFYTEKVTPAVVKRTIFCTLCFILAICIPIFTSLRLKWEDPKRHCGFPCTSELETQGQVYVISLFVILLVIFVGNIILYVWVAKTALKQHIKIIDEMANRSTTPHYNKLEMRNTKIMVIMFGVFIMLWLPYMVVLSLHVIGVCHTIANECTTARDLTVALGIFNSGLNCYIYAWQKKDFKSTIRLMLRRSRKRNQVVPIPPNVTARQADQTTYKESVFTISSKLSSRPTELSLIATCQSSSIDNSTDDCPYSQHQQSQAPITSDC